MPLDNSSGGTIVCREHLQRITRIRNSKVHVYAPNSDAASSTGHYVRSLGAAFHELYFSLDPRNAVAPDSRKDLSSCLGADLSKAFMFEKMAFECGYVDVRFRTIFDHVRPDIIVLDYLYTALFIPSAFHCGVPLTMITLNREREFYHQQCELRRLPRDASDLPDAESRLERLENEVYGNVDSLVTLTPNDVPKDPAIAARTTVIEPVLEAYEHKWAWSGGRNLFFVGNLQHYPNFAAACWLCESLAPALEQADPRVRITIIGADVAEVPDPWRRPNVELLGRSTQEEVQRQFSNCGLFIAPIENSFGSKIKILECVAHATPLVATSEALTGLPSTDGIPQFSLADPHGAAGLVSRLLDSRRDLEELSATLQTLLRAHLTRSELAWPPLVARLAAQPPMNRAFLEPSFLRPRPHPFKKSVFLEVAMNEVHWVYSVGLFAVEPCNRSFLRWTAPQAEFTIIIDPDQPPRWMNLRFWHVTPPEGINFAVFANGTRVTSGSFCGRKLRRAVRLPQLAGLEELTIRIETPGFRFENDVRALGVAIESIRLSRHWWSAMAIWWSAIAVESIRFSRQCWSLLNRPKRSIATQASQSRKASHASAQHNQTQAQRR